MTTKNDQVLQLYMEKLSGTITPEDETVLRDMLSDDPALLAFYTELENHAASMPLDEFHDNTDAQQSLQALQQKIKQRSSRRIYRTISSIAASLLIIAAGIYFLAPKTRPLVDIARISAAVEKQRSSISLKLSNGQSVDLGITGSTNTKTKSQPIVIGATTLHTTKNTLDYTSEDTSENTLTVPAGENYKLILSDGTEVTLNAATRLKFPFKFGKTTRDVYIDGEAYFKVAEDIHRPFIVHTPLTRINVLGTSFNVNTYEKDRVKTSLVTGKVSTQSNTETPAARNAGPTMLTPGYAASFQATKGFSTEKFDEDDELSWTSGVYYFHDMPFADLARMAARCYGVHIIFDETKFSGKSVSGLLDRNKLADFLSDIESTIHVTYRFAGNNLYLE